MNESPENLNPFAAPTSQPATPTIPQSPQPLGGLWREGDNLVMHKQAGLPPLCVETGVAVVERGIVTKMSWHNPMLALTIFFGCVIYIILSVVLSKTAVIEIPLSPKSKNSRSKAIWVSTLVGLIGVLGFFGSFLLTSQESTTEVGFACLAGSVAMIILALFYGNGRARILKPTKITDTHVWLQGVHPSIIERLPPLPAENPAAQRRGWKKQ